MVVGLATADAASVLVVLAGEVGPELPADLEVLEQAPRRAAMPTMMSTR
jgi:hypothetical protein